MLNQITNMPTIRSIKISQNTTFVTVLVTVLILAAYLRLDGISWDQGFSYSPHPDERAILMKYAEIEFPNDNIKSLLIKDFIFAFTPESLPITI